MRQQAAFNSQEETLALLQRVALDITSTVSSICERNNISYTLIFGSLIGAVRHNGFIPWDDDLDIAMPRPDFERFLTVAGDELPEYYELHNYKFGNTQRYVTRVVDKRLLLKLGSYADDKALPAWVDIFVLDGIPDNEPAKTIHYLRIQWHKAMCAFASFDATVNRNRPGRPKWQQVIIDLCDRFHFGSRLNIKRELEKYDRALKRYSFDCSSLCCCGVGTYSPHRQTWKREAFEGLEKRRFEGAEFMCAKDFDSILSVTYGDYMTLPSADKRIVHTAMVYRNDMEEQITE